MVGLGGKRQTKKKATHEVQNWLSDRDRTVPPHYRHAKAASKSQTSCSRELQSKKEQHSLFLHHTNVENGALPPKGNAAATHCA